MACYNVFADLSWSDFTEAQQLDSANPPSFVDHLTNANFLNDPFLHPIDFPDLALPLNFHQGFIQDLDSPRTLSKPEETTFVATLNESITVLDRQIPSVGEHELKAHKNLLQQISKAKLLGEDNGHKSRVLGDANTTICKFKINQAELEDAERLGDPSVALFLEHHLGSIKWHIFTEKRVDKGKPSEQQRSSIIDFLVKTEIIKEVFRKFLPPAYSEVNYAVHTWSRSPNGRGVILTRANVFTLSGWSKVFFSYWSRRAEHLALFSLHDDLLRIIGLELERRLSQDLHDLDFTTNTVVQSLIQMTTRKLDAVLKMTKDRTGLNPTKLRGKHSILDAYGAAKDRFLASNHSTSRSGAAAPFGCTSDSRRYDPISSVINPVSPDLSAHLESSLVSSSKYLRRNAKSTPGRSVFKLQHTIVPAVEVSKDQLDFEFEWQLN